MNLTFLGTAAATSYPLAFCRCEFCETARQRGGKNLRKRASLLVNRDLILDFGPDVLSASFQYGVSVADIRYCLQTHPHSDHFDASHITTRIPEYMGVDTPHLELVASKKTLQKMSEMIANEGYVPSIFEPAQQARLNISLRQIDPLQPTKVGPYMVTAFVTDHDTNVESRLYAITQEDTTIFYGTDTDTLLEETWQGMKDLNLKFDLLVLDHTYGPNADSGGHLNSNRVIEHIRRMKQENLLKTGARIFATHLSHEGNPPHEELSQIAQENGYEVAFDGLNITL